MIQMPFGAVLADAATGEILFRAHNECPAASKRGGGMGDVTRHAEMELIRRFTAHIPNDQRKFLTLYTSTEPCVMCAGAIYWSGVGRVVFGCSAAQLEEHLSGPGGFDVDIYHLYTLGGNRKIDIAGPLLAQESLRVHDQAGVWKYKLKAGRDGEDA